MTAGPTLRRGSFVETWRLFASGWSWPLLLLMFVITVMFVPNLKNPAGLFANVGVGTFCFWLLTLVFEAAVVDRLAFLSLTPQPVALRWLVLLPLYAGAVSTAAFSLRGRLPALSSVVWLGCALWTIGATRWSRKMPTWALPIALAIPAAAAFAAFQAFRVGGWGASAAVAMSMALVALLFQPGPVLTEERSRLKNRRRRAAEATDDRQVSKVADGRWPWLASAVRYRLLNGPRTAAVIVSCLTASFPLTSLAFGMGMMSYLLMAVVLSVSWDVYSDESAEFIRTRPFTKGQLFVSGTVVPLIPVLLLPVLALPLVTLEWFNGGGLRVWLIGWTHHHQQTLNYVRNVLGATFLPVEWPSIGLTPDQWLLVRPLLYWDLVRCTLLAIAFNFAFAPVRGSRAGQRTRPWIGQAIYWMVFAWSIRNSFGGESDRPNVLPVLPVWLAALLAAAAIANWSWAARFLKAHARGEIDSTLRGAA